MQPEANPVPASDAKTGEYLRRDYARRFNNKVKVLAGEKYNDTHFNALTQYHGSSYQNTQKWLDVATKTPTGKPVGDAYSVAEPGNVGSARSGS